MAQLYSEKNTSLLKVLLVLCASGLSGCSTLASNGTDVEQGVPQQGIQRHLYAGTGIGPSWLEPDTSEVSGYDVNERAATGGQITLGMDLSRQLAVELHSADLGSAGLYPTGRVNYHIHGVSGLLYAGKNRHNYKRRGLSGYGRVGLGYLNNSIDGTVEGEQTNQTHILTGAGIEYMTRFGLGLRVEGILFDQDARYAQLGLIYRTGRRPTSKPVEIVQTPTPVVAPVPAVAVIEKPAPVIAEPVVAEVIDTCSEFEGVLEGVNFHSNSSKLTRDATNILNGVATRLLECESVPVRISAHTDSIGAEAYNQNLSQQRANSVVEYLSEQGVDRNRLSPTAFGESQPIDTNGTPEGRKRNRRVELSTAQ